MLAAATVFASTQTQTTQDKPWRIYQLGGAMNTSDSDHSIEDDYFVNIYPEPYLCKTSDSQTTSGKSVVWVNGLGGGGSGMTLNNSITQGTYGDSYINYDNALENDSINLDWTGVGSEYQTTHKWGFDYGSSYDYPSWWPVNLYETYSGYFANEHCDVTDSAQTPFWTYEYNTESGPVLREITQTETYQRYAQAVWHVQTGGKSIPGRQNLWQFNGGAQEVLDKRATPPWYNVSTREITNKTQIALGSLGNLKADGTLWIALPDDVDKDITPTVAGMSFYKFSVGGQKYPINIGLTTATTNANLDTDVPEVCVGQQATFVLNGLPMGSISNMVGRWTLPAKYVNAKLQYINGVTSPNYFVNDWLLQNTNQTSCWFVNGNGSHVLVGLNILFTDGQYASVAANGDITVYRPSFQDFSTANSGGGFTNSARTFIWDGNILSYGNESTGEHAQFWSAMINSKYNGAIGILQLVNAEYTQNFGWCPDCRDTLNTGGDSWLDGTPTGSYQDPNNYTEFTYLTSVISSHTIDISDQPEGNLWVASPINVRLFGQFSDYLRFIPSGSSSISITLATNSWSMEGLAKVTGGIVTNSTPIPTPLVTSDSFPVWTQIKSSK